jgi:predicted alpha/beta hydrolase
MKAVTHNFTKLDIQTEDGWKLTAYHHANLTSAHLPVLVFHAMSLSAYSLNGNGTLPSIASWLSRNGYDVWVCECRGVGKSYHPDRKKRCDWSFDDHLNYDVPAFIHSLQIVTGKEKFHWIGHSMGGALLLAYLCTTMNPPIQMGIIAGSGFEVSNHIGTTEIPIKFLNIFRIKRIPLKTVSRLSKPFFKFIPDNCSFFSKKFTGYSNCLEIMKDIHDIPTALLMFALKSYRKGGFRDASDKVIYSKMAKNVSIPLLFLSGDADLAWIPSVVEENLKFFSKGNAKMLPLGKAYGHSDHYGHVDMLMGKNVQKEVFPEILKWLDMQEIGRTA